MKLKFERIETDISAYIFRAKVYGGWLIAASEDVITIGEQYAYNPIGFQWRTSVTFIPDPEHKWIGD